MYGVIYKITNLINGKVYIGQTIRSIKDRFRQHCNCGKQTGLHAAIKKYGKENFAIEQIDVADDKVHLNELEKYWITVYDSIAPIGYNLSEGGESHIQTNDTKLTLSEKLKEYYKTHDNPMKGVPSPMRGKVGAMNGKKHTPDTIEKMRCSRSGIRSHVRKSVLCVETGEIFMTMRDAARKYNVPFSCISDAVKGIKQTRAAGLHWECVR